MIETIEAMWVLALVAIAFQLVRVHRAIERLRVEISSARWEVGKMVRLEKPDSGREGF